MFNKLKDKLKKGKKRTEELSPAEQLTVSNIQNTGTKSLGRPENSAPAPVRDTVWLDPVVDNASLVYPSHRAPGGHLPPPYTRQTPQWPLPPQNTSQDAPPSRIDHLNPSPEATENTRKPSPARKRTSIFGALRDNLASASTPVSNTATGSNITSTGSTEAARPVPKPTQVVEQAPLAQIKSAAKPTQVVAQNSPAQTDDYDIPSSVPPHIKAQGIQAIITWLSQNQVAKPVEATPVALHSPLVSARIRPTTVIKNEPSPVKVEAISDTTAQRSRPYAGFSKAHAKEAFEGTSDSLNIRPPPGTKPVQLAQASKPAVTEPSTPLKTKAATSGPVSGSTSETIPTPVTTSTPPPKPVPISTDNSDVSDGWGTWGFASQKGKQKATTPGASTGTASTSGWDTLNSTKASELAAASPKPTSAPKKTSPWFDWDAPLTKEERSINTTPSVSKRPGDSDGWEDWGIGSKEFKAKLGAGTSSAANKLTPQAIITATNTNPTVSGPAKPPTPATQPSQVPSSQAPKTSPLPNKFASNPFRQPPSETEVPKAPTSTSSISTPKPPTAEAVPEIPSAAAAPADAEAEGQRFNIQVNNTIWPEFAPEIGGMERTGQIFLDFASTLTTRWAKGDPVGPNQFGTNPITDKPALGGDLLPVRLYDLVDKKVVLSRAIPANIHYAAISHVWGDKLEEIDGSKYGVEWKIPVRSQYKLDLMLEAARILMGVEFVWLDILCLDQRKKNENEISKMKMYYGNAVECLVWLENTYDEDQWKDSLASLEEVNKFYRLDKHGTPTISATDLFSGGFGANAPPVFNLSMNETECFNWILKLTALEKAAWFKRVWTLQEAVIPDKLVFCTPEKYITRGGNLFQIVGLCGTIAKMFMDMGIMTGVAISHQLQKSECWKILRLRQLFQKKELSYWHVSRAMRTRTSKIPQDYIFGGCGMISGNNIIINYDRSIEGLHQELWKNSIDGGDFAACCFLGGSTFHPHLTQSMGLITPQTGREAETHTLLANENSIRMDGVGIDTVTRVHALITGGTVRPWGEKYPEFMSLTIQDHVDIAFAFETPTKQVSRLCPGAFAALACGNPFPEDLLSAFGDEFKEAYWDAYPRGLMTWIKGTMLMPKAEPRSYGVVILWTDSSVPQLAIVTEPVVGRVIIVTPSSYVESPGNSCLVCQVREDGSIKKIGVGVGSKVKAKGTGSLLLTA